MISVGKGRFDLLLDFLSTRPDTAGRPPVIMFNHPHNTLNPSAKEYGADDFSSPAEFVRRMGAQANLIQMITGSRATPAAITARLPPTRTRFAST